MNWYLDASYRHMHACLNGAQNGICPEKLYLDLTEDCNLYCRMCRGERRMDGRTMPMELYTRLVDETAPYVRSYSLFNWGESLLLPDIRERIEYLAARKRSDAVIDISTNGTPLTEDMIAFLREREIAVVVSFDGADERTFEWIRRGARYEQVLRNTERLARAYADFPIERSPQMYMSVQRANANQVLALVRLADSIGVRAFGCGVVTNPQEFAAEPNDALFAEMEAAFSYIEKRGMFLSVYPTKLGGRVCWGGKYVPADGFRVNTCCDAPRIDATIAYNGDVYLCCNIGAKVGNVADGSFLELWKSAAYEDMRSAVNDPARMPEHCVGCSWYNRN